MSTGPSWQAALIKNAWENEPMIDFLKLFFVAAKYSAGYFTSPREDTLSRRMQLLVLLLAVSGTLVFAAGVFHALWFDFRGTLWVWLSIAGGALWCVSGCIGNMLDDRSQVSSDQDKHESLDH